MIEPITKLLVADDSDRRRREVRTILMELGLRKEQIEEARDGKEAYDKAQEKEYVAIIMDIDMPEGGGKKATQAIRAGNGPNAGTAIIAYTSDITESTSEKEIREYLRLGFNYALPKDTDVLKATLSEHLKRCK